MSVRAGSAGFVDELLETPGDLNLPNDGPSEPMQPRDLQTIQKPKITLTEDRVWRQESSCSPDLTQERIKIPLNTKMTSVKPFSKTPRRTQTSVEKSLQDILPFRDEPSVEYFNRVIFNDQRFYVPHDLKDLFETVNPRAPPLRVVYPMHIMQAVRKVKPQLTSSKPNAVVATPVERYRITMKYIQEGHNPRVIDGLVAHIQHRPEFEEKLFYTTLKGKRIRRSCRSLSGMDGRISSKLAQNKYLSPIDDRIRPGVDFERMYSNLEYTSTHNTHERSRQSQPLQGAILKRKLHKNTARLASIGVQTGNPDRSQSCRDSFENDEDTENVHPTPQASVSGVTRLTGDIANALDTLSSIGKPISVERVIASDLNSRLSSMRKTKDIPIIPSNVCYPRIIGMTRFQGRPTKGELAIVKGRLSNTSKVAFTQTPGGTTEFGVSVDDRGTQPDDPVMQGTAMRKEQTDSGIQSPTSSDVDETENDLVNEGRKRVTWSREIRQNQRRGLTAADLDTLPGIAAFGVDRSSSAIENVPPVTPATNPSPSLTDNYSVYVNTTQRPATPKSNANRIRSNGHSAAKAPSTIIDELPEGESGDEPDDVIKTKSPATERIPSRDTVRLPDIAQSRANTTHDPRANGIGTPERTADDESVPIEQPDESGEAAEEADSDADGRRLSDEDYQSTVFITDRAPELEDAA